MPEISVIVPVYNKERHLESCLTSVLNQPIRDLEVIAVNDGSTDGCGKILERFAQTDPRLHVWTVPNGGVSKARNFGLVQAKGNWIQFLDADDFLEPGYLAQAMKVLQKTPAEILFSGFTMVDEQGVPLREIALEEQGLRGQSDLCRLFLQYQPQNGFFGFIANKLFRRSLVEASGARFPVGTTLAEDLDFYVHLYPSVKTALFWPGKSFCYRQTASNYCYAETIDYYAQLEIRLHIKEWFVGAGLYPQHREQLDGWVAQYAAYFLFQENEQGREPAKGIARLRSRRDILACIEPRYGAGAQRVMLWALKYDHPAALKRLFQLRNFFHFGYRKVTHRA